MTKKLISTLTSIALLAGVAAMPAAAEETFALGDVTMDGKVDSMDVINIMLQYHFSWSMEENYLTEEQLPLADTTSDGAVDTCDAIFALQYYGYTLVTTDPVNSDAFFSDDFYHEEVKNDDEYREAMDDVYVRADVNVDEDGECDVSITVGRDE